MRSVRVAERRYAHPALNAAIAPASLADEPRLARRGNQVGRKVVAIIDESGRIAIRGATGRVTSGLDDHADATVHSSRRGAWPVGA